MKIGILTYHRSHNYGALLQAIALRQVLVEAGHSVTFIDYWPPYHRHMYALFSFSWLISCKGVMGKINYIRSCTKYYSYRKARIKNFNMFISEFIEPYLSSMNEKYDIVVHGSDQIWRKQPELYKYNPVYFGLHQIKTKSKISYAASMGILPKNELEKTAIRNYLSHLDHISVRERDLFEMVVEMGFRNVRQDLDPTLLLPMDFWVNHFLLKKNDEHYALYYMIQSSFNLTELRDFVKSKGLKLKIIHSQARCVESEENVTTANPLRFLELIYGAEIVFTSSFHGLAFSLIFHKPFIASFTKNAGRAISLLSLVGLENNLIPPKSSMPLDIQPIDFTVVENRIKSASELSISSLTGYLTEIN